MEEMDVAGVCFLTGGPMTRCVFMYLCMNYTERAEI